MRPLLTAGFSAAMLALATSLSGAQTLLIDDFSIPQQGISAGQFVEFDQLDDPALFEGGRELWGGGNSACAVSTITTSVSGGEMRSTPGADCSGATAVTWPRFLPDTSFDLSGFGAMLIEVAEVRGVVDQRITFQKGVTTASLVLTPQVQSAGILYLPFPDGVDLSSTRHITIGSLLERGEYIAISAVWLQVPEPSSGLLVLLSLPIASLQRWRAPVQA